jgi:hypothetical protein
MIKKIARVMFKEMSEVLLDYSEIALDDIASNEAIRELPIIKTIVSFWKGTLSIRELYFSKKMAVFIQEMKKGNISELAFAERLAAIEHNEEWLYKEVERIVVAIDRLDRENKAKICAQLYVAYLKQYIKQRDFDDLLSITERWFESDTEQLLSIFQEVEWGRNKHEMEAPYIGYLTWFDPVRCGRLVGLGLLSTHLQIVSRNSQIEYKITHHGVILSEILKHGYVYTDHYKSEREATKKEQNKQ